MVLKKRFEKKGATVKRTLKTEGIIAAGSETEGGGIR